MLQRMSFPPAVCSFLLSVMSLPRAALERYSTLEKLSRIFRQPSSSTRLKSCSPIIWMFCSSRIFRSTKLTTVTSPMCSTSRRRRRAGDDIRHSLGVGQVLPVATARLGTRSRKPGALRQLLAGAVVAGTLQRRLQERHHLDRRRQVHRTFPRLEKRHDLLAQLAVDVPR